MRKTGFQPLLELNAMKELLKDEQPRKELSSWSSKRSTGILWNFAKICALLDFTCGGLLGVVDYFGR